MVRQTVTPMSTMQKRSLKTAYIIQPSHNSESFFGVSVEVINSNKLYDFYRTWLAQNHGRRDLSFYKHGSWSHLVGQLTLKSLGGHQPLVVVAWSKAISLLLVEYGSRTLDWQ